MSGRKVIIDPEERRSALQTACPTCGTPLSSLNLATLQPIRRNLFRNVIIGLHRTFEARCRSCRRLLVVMEGDHGLVLVPGDQDALLRWIREADREDMEPAPRGGRRGGGPR